LRVSREFLGFYIFNIVIWVQMPQLIISAMMIYFLQKGPFLGQKKGKQGTRKIFLKFLDFIIKKTPAHSLYIIEGLLKRQQRALLGNEIIIPCITLQK